MKTAPVEVVEPQPDAAWKILLVTNDWIKHADSKIAVTLAFVAATGVMLYNLVHGLNTWKPTTVTFTVVTIILLSIAVCCSVAALAPRTTPSKGSSPNPLFFGDIAAMDKATYRKTLVALTSTNEDLVGETADQVHENSTIATKKHRRVKWAVKFELAAAIVVAGLALLQTVGW